MTALDTVRYYASRWLDLALKALLWRRIKINQRYVVYTWDNFEKYNQEYPDIALSFTSYAVFGKPRRLFAARRVRIVGHETYAALRSSVDSSRHHDLHIQYRPPSNDCAGYSAFIYMHSPSVLTHP